MATHKEAAATAVVQQTAGETAEGGKETPIIQRKPPKKPAKQKSGKSAKKPAAHQQSKQTGKKNHNKQEQGQNQQAGQDGGKPKPRKGNPFARVRKTIKDELPEIVDTMVKKAKGGSCTHAKTILEISGAKHMFDGEHQAKEKGQPWAKLVLQKLDEAEREPTGEAAPDGDREEKG